MAVHISARVAWHMDGWNGHICREPAENTYCVGRHSYPGELIRERRNLDWEGAHAGECCSQVDGIPPCVFSVNAFGRHVLTAFSEPPSWFNGGATRREWALPPATVCVWPYEQMYSDDVYVDGKLNHEKRLANAKAYFADIANDRSLIFYYSNYSNPFSEDEAAKYVVVGISRVKHVGDQEYYENRTQDIINRYAGGYVWARNITSHYPDEGFCIPYHRYRDEPQHLERLLLVPDNPRNFKFGTRHFSDDEALNLVERLLEICSYLEQIGDKSENWAVRADWLRSLIAELWKSRGLYPGTAHILDYLGFNEAVPYWMEATLAGRETDALNQLVNFLDGSSNAISGVPLTEERRKKIRRDWVLRYESERLLLSEVLPRFDIPRDQLSLILSEDRANNSISATLDEIRANPYVLSEQFVGNGPDDILPFYRIDHGVFPSPQLGGEFLAEKDDWRRLRGLCVERLRMEGKHTFLPASQVIHDINNRLSVLPEWKRHQFTQRYFQVDREDLEGTLTFREFEGRTYLYLSHVYEAERVVEEQIRRLVNRPDINLSSPVTERHWENYLYEPESILARNNPDKYREAIAGQVRVCQQVFPRPVSVLSGSAGTGKTTVIRALIQAVEKAHGVGTSFCLLAPTGKAADRIREATGKEAFTVHSFLARKGWLNDNMTFKTAGGKLEDRYSTYIVDEASMLDLELAAALFRAIRWATVQRLILVGDQSQLPPIGKGRVFADIMDWLQAQGEGSVAVLETNIRQMANRLEGRGEAILDLASVYERVRAGEDDAVRQARAEELFRGIQEGGDVDKDLRIEFWDTPEVLADRLVARIVEDMESDTSTKLDPSKPYKLWWHANSGGGDKKRADYHQVLSPYRGEPFGTENLNLILQKASNSLMLERKGNVEGITIFDKVIQIVNRPKSNPIWAWNTQTRKNEQIEVFNGEIGFVDVDLRDRAKNSFGKAAWLAPSFRVQRFQVEFSRKTHYRVNYGGANDVRQNLELAYALSTHKAQGSEFERVYFVIPKEKQTLLSREMFYTGLTRASRHCTLLIQQDISPLLSMYRLENSSLVGINSSLFEFHPVPEALLDRRGWYQEGRIHETLADVMVRSKSEVIIANMLAERDIAFEYEVRLTAPDGTFYLPDFTVTWAGERFYWEHLGRLDLEEYRNHWEMKKAWYDKFFPGRVVTTVEAPDLSHQANNIIAEHFAH